MKISNKVYTKLKAAILVAIEITGYTEKYYISKNLYPQRAARRYRWAILRRSTYSWTELYAEGLDDTHIDTALRKIMKEIQLPT